MENSNQPAFACGGTYNPNNGNHNGDNQIGLSKREYFAGQALIALLSNTKPPFIYENITHNAVVLADNLLKALEK